MKFDKEESLKFFDKYNKELYLGALVLISFQNNIVEGIVTKFHKNEKISVQLKDKIKIRTYHWTRSGHEVKETYVTKYRKLEPSKVFLL